MELTFGSLLDGNLAKTSVLYRKILPESCMKINENHYLMSHYNHFDNILTVKHLAHMGKGGSFLFLINFHPIGEPEASICGVTKGSQ